VDGLKFLPQSANKRLDEERVGIARAFELLDEVGSAVVHGDDGRFMAYTFLNLKLGTFIFLCYDLNHGYK